MLKTFVEATFQSIRKVLFIVLAVKTTFGYGGPMSFIIFIYKNPVLSISLSYTADISSETITNLLFINKAKMGGFSGQYYWTVSESSDGRAWLQFFNDGTQDDYYKISKCWVRAVHDL